MKNNSAIFLILSLGLISILGFSNRNVKTGSDELTLRKAASFPVGAAINIKRLFSDEKFRKIHSENFSSVTARGEMKMNRILPSEGNYYWDDADSLVMYSKENNQRLFGHNLIWHSSTPEWVEEKAMGDSAWLAGFMKDYIHTYVGRYKGKVDGWDVINEGMNTAGGGYRETMWYNILGKDYIRNAFMYAHEADPDAVLFYNDFNIERDTAKLHSVLRMIEEFQEEGVPISGLGFQMHIRMDIPDSIIAYALKKGAETGLQIHLSEVDIIFNKHDDNRGGGIQLYHEFTDSMKTAQAEKYKNLVRMYKTIVPEEQQYGITFWGFNDRDTWINGFFGLQDWPCLFDENLKPKPAYYGFLEGLEE